MLNRIDHIGVAVDDIDSALALWRDQLGLEVSHRETVPEQGVDAVLLDVGDNHVELLAPLSADSAVGKFLAKRGPGMHHVAYEVGHIEDALVALRAAGLTPLDERPRVGLRGSLVAFLEPRTTGRVLIELVQPATVHRPAEPGRASNAHTRSPQTVSP